MTDEGDRDPDDEDHETGPADVDVSLGGLLGSVGELIEALGEIERAGDGSRSTRGRVDRDSFTVDYSYDVDIGIGGEDIRRPSDERRRDPKRTVDVDDHDPDPDYTVDVREYEGEVVVTADVPGINEDDLDARVEDDGTLAIVAGDDVVERVPVDAELSVIDVSFKNQILQIRLQHREGSDDE